MNALLLYPANPDTFWSFKHALKFVSRKSSAPPLGILTIAAMLPSDWNIRVVDLSVSKLKDASLQWADMVMISAMIVQRESALEIVKRSKLLGKVVVAGGPLFTAYREEFENCGIDHFILNDGEATLPRFLTDWEQGNARKVYTEAKMPPLKNSPIPRWDLVNLNNYAEVNIQYSRGCPFDCDFCDIGVLFGRKIRTKSSDQVLSELDTLFDMNYKGNVFFVDDNFIGNKQRLKSDLLPALNRWQKAHGYPFTFSTEASIDLADDEILRYLMVACGFTAVFIGIETTNEEALQECNKVQNRNRDMIKSIHKIHSSGMMVKGGFIVGFDTDDETVFDTMIRFIQSSGIVTAMVGILSAPKGTRLYQRLLEEKRITGYSSGNNTDLSVNFLPKMSMTKLIEGYKHIIYDIYTPKPFYRRVRKFLTAYKPAKLRLRPIVKKNNILALLKSFWVLGVLHKERFHYWRLLFWTIRKRPELFATAVTMAIYGFHFRRVFEL